MQWKKYSCGPKAAEESILDVSPRARAGVVGLEARQGLAARHAGHASTLELLLPETRGDLREVHHRPLGAPTASSATRQFFGKRLLGPVRQTFAHRRRRHLIQRAAASHVQRRLRTLALAQTRGDLFAKRHVRNVLVRLGERAPPRGTHRRPASCSAANLRSPGEAAGRPSRTSCRTTADTR